MRDENQALYLLDWRRFSSELSNDMLRELVRRQEDGPTMGAFDSDPLFLHLLRAATEWSMQPLMAMTSIVRAGEATWQEFGELEHSRDVVPDVVRFTIVRPGAGDVD
jgi:hypothetical protein